MFSRIQRVVPVWHKQASVFKKWKGGTSALYIPGDEAAGKAVSVVPYVDLTPVFKNMDALRSNISCRGMSINLDLIKDSWEQLESEEDTKASLEEQHQALLFKIKELRKADKKSEADKLLEDARAIQEQVKTIKKVIWDLERKAIIGGLSIPNHLHHLTPTGDEGKPISSFGLKPDAPKESHLSVASKLDLVDFYDSSFYFLKKDAALFELGLSYLFLDEMGDRGFLHMSNSDFGRSVVVEGVGLDPEDPSSVFIVKGDTSEPSFTKLHLVGGASLVSFCAFHAKCVAQFSILPLRYVTLGRHYSPEAKNSLPGLFSPWQSSAVEVFVATPSSESSWDEFENTLNVVTSLYKSLDYHFRVEYLPARSLRPWESLRASIQMFSAHLNCYVEVGNLSLCEDFISKRLLMCYNRKDGQKDFLHVVSGTVVSIPHVLACVLESEGEDFSLPTAVSKKT